MSDCWIGLSDAAHTKLVTVFYNKSNSGSTYITCRYEMCVAHNLCKKPIKVNRVHYGMTWVESVQLSTHSIIISSNSIDQVDDVHADFVWIEGGNSQ